MYVAVGIHPNSCGDFDDDCLDALRRLAAHERVIAIGEIGLDYYWDKCPKAKQKEALEAQLELAAELSLPVILHNREAGSDLLAVLAAWAPSTPAGMTNRRGVLHSFSASADIARRAISLGFYLGFTGPITYKKADELRAVAAEVPLERIVIETDGPFLAPQRHRGKRNEPAYVRFINDKLAELRGITPESMAEQTTRNAETLFALPGARSRD